MNFGWYVPVLLLQWGALIGRRALNRITVLEVILKGKQPRENIQCWLKFPNKNCGQMSGKSKAKSTFLILSASFFSTSCYFSSGITKNRCFLVWDFVFVLSCSFTKFTKKKTGSVFPAICHATSHHALITCCNVSRVGYKCITIGIHLILAKATWPRFNQWQFLFSWVKV